MKRLVNFAAILLCGILSHPAAYAGDITAPAAITPSGTLRVVASGPGNQVGARVSGDFVAYASCASPQYSDHCTIHYVNLADGSDVAIPGPDGTFDNSPELSGNTIVFTRSVDYMTDVIYAYDLTSKTSTPLAWNGRVTHRGSPSIGGRTVAWQQRVYDGWPAEIVVYDLDSNTATPLTTDDAEDYWPRVSPDGSTVVWMKVVANANQLWQATRNADGTWTSEQLTTAAMPYTGMATNGELIAYSALRDGDYYQRDIVFQPVGGGTETRVVLPGCQWAHEMSGRLVVFSAFATTTANSDIFAYDVETNTLYQITDTPDRVEDWPDVWLDADGTAHVVFTDCTTDDRDVLEFSFHLERRYTVQPLFNQDHAYKFRGVVPLKLQLLDAQGHNVSSPDIVISATEVVPVGGETPSDVVEAGNASPDTNFRYDATLGGYVFNLSTKNLAPGTWELRFRAGSDTSPYSIKFSLR